MAAATPSQEVVGQWQLVVADLGISLLVSTASGGGTAGENRDTTTVLSGDDGVIRRYLVEGIFVATFFYSIGLFHGKP
jgi:hypothetical protein